MKKGPLLSPLHYLFQKSLKIGKEIRTAFPLPKGNYSLENALWNLIVCFFSLKRPIRILFIGFSLINRRILSFYRTKEGVQLSLVTRNPKAAEEIQKKQEVKILPWEEISSWGEFDVVIAGSKALNYLVTLEQLPQDLSLVQNRLVIDLGVPRNVDPLVGRHPLVTLFNIAEIGDFMAQQEGLSLLKKKEIQQDVENKVIRQMSLYEQKNTKAFSCV